jgi:hypothetical protein
MINLVAVGDARTVVMRADCQKVVVSLCETGNRFMLILWSIFPLHRSMYVKKITILQRGAHRPVDSSASRQNVIK